ncbi:MAG: hypothetical protein ACOCVF_03730 [bacterium]
MIKKYNQFVTENINEKLSLIKEEAAPRIPNSPEYWEKKGKDGKKVMLYFHDDLDGIFSAVAIKKYLLSKGFELVGYGIVNYQEGWDVITLNPEYINVAVDFAELTDGIDIYIDHHGEFKEEDDVKSKQAVKTKTKSAYEGIMDQLGLPVDSLILDVISMVDAARYDDYEVKWTDLLTWDMEHFKKHKNPKLMFTGVFNQMLKRSDYRTFIEVVHNATEPSIYQIFRLFQLLYPMNNLFWRKMKDIRSVLPGANEYMIWQMAEKGEFDTEEEKVKAIEIFTDFLEDGSQRLDQVNSRTSGKAEFKDVYKSQSDFVADNTEIKEYPETSRSRFAGMSAQVIKPDGYCVIGELVYVPSGTWANAIRARSIIERDINTGRLKGVNKEDIKWVLLQYGDTLQICSFGDINEYDSETLPQTREGKVIDDLKTYTKDLLKRFQTKLGFKNDDTISGGHTGIGTISNIGVSRFYYTGDKDNMNKLNNLRYLDLFKNYIIANLSQIPWDISLSWENPFSPDRPEEPVPEDARIMKINQIRKVDVNKQMKVEIPKNYEHKPNMGDLKKAAAALKIEQEILEKERLEDAKKEAQAKHQFYRKKREDGLSYDEWSEQQKEKTGKVQNK